jgi:L-lactate dehydrogenase complex protein LldE
MTATSPVRASLFVTCLVDQLYPQVGIAAVNVLRRLGVQVDFPEEQTCCGQLSINTGYQQETRDLARRFLETFQDSEYIVAPSSSCTGMIKKRYPQLFKDDPKWRAAAQAIDSRLYEFSEFLTDVLGVTDVGAIYNGTVTYHPSCHGLRELGLDSQPQALIRNVKDIRYVELPEMTTCCGFGGTFSVKYADISEAILEDKVNNVVASGADTLVGVDMSCLMNIGGAISRRGDKVRVMHLAELLDSRED